MAFSIGSNDDANTFGAHKFISKIVKLKLSFGVWQAYCLPHDATNGLGSSYGTKAIPWWSIVSNGVMAEFVGAMICSDKVSEI